MRDKQVVFITRQVQPATRDTRRPLRVRRAKPARAMTPRTLRDAAVVMRAACRRRMHHVLVQHRERPAAARRDVSHSCQHRNAEAEKTANTVEIASGSRLAHACTGRIASSAESAIAAAPTATCCARNVRTNAATSIVLASTSAKSLRTRRRARATLSRGSLQRDKRCAGRCPHLQ
eukprot:6176166-Pleurochrysis_carterae.AAC.1